MARSNAATVLNGPATGIMLHGLPTGTGTRRSSHRQAEDTRALFLLRLRTRMPATGELSSKAEEKVGKKFNASCASRHSSHCGTVSSRTSHRLRSSGNCWTTHLPRLLPPLPPLTLLLSPWKRYRVVDTWDSRSCKRLRRMTSTRCGSSSCANSSRCFA